MKAKQPAVEAVRLLGKWQRVSGGHVAFGAGCSCGAAAISVRVQDYEQDILAFLQRRHRTQAGSIRVLLTDIAAKGASADLRILEDLERSLESFESLHRGGGCS
jgi:hypothetical protein